MDHHRDRDDHRGRARPAARRQGSGSADVESRTRLTGRTPMRRSVLIVLALAACSKGMPGANPKTFRIAMIAKSSTNPVFLAARTGAEVAAAELSKANGVDIKIDWLTPP